MPQKVLIVGSGIGGLATAALLAHDGYEVEVLEKNEQLGGRMSVFEADGFRFDMGPSWYLMPEVFERYFGLLDEKVADHLDLIRLSPSYRIYFKDKDRMIDIHGDLTKDLPTLEAFEPGMRAPFMKFLDRASRMYRMAMDHFLYRNYDRLSDFWNPKLLFEEPWLAFRTLTQKVDAYLRSYFRNEDLIKVLEYTLVFLGSSPYNAPGIYSMMTHIDFRQGVFYPQGGMGEIPRSIAAIAAKHGMKHRLNAEVSRIIVENGRAAGVELAGGERIDADIVISNADRHWTETKLLADGQREHDEKYWDKRTMAPSAFILYLGVKGSLPPLLHHTLIFSQDWDQNFSDIFDRPRFVRDPSIYLCCPSKTDPTVAPEGHENLFILVPFPSGIETSESDLEDYATKTIATVAKTCGIPDLAERITYRRVFCIRDFEQRYHAYRGTGLGLAHTLMQTALWRPSNRSKKVQNLYFVGGDTVPGIGVPMQLIGAELVRERVGAK